MPWMPTLDVGTRGGVIVIVVFGFLFQFRCHIGGTLSGVISGDEVYVNAYGEKDALLTKRYRECGVERPVGLEL